MGEALIPARERVQWGWGGGGQAGVARRNGNGVPAQVDRGLLTGDDTFEGSAGRKKQICPKKD